MSIVVTGATGQLGRLIIERLIARGTAPTDIIAAGRNAERLASVASLGVTTASIDLATPATLDAAFAGSDTLMLVSGSEVGQRVPQHLNAIAAAKRTGITRIIYTSAPHADTSALILAPDHKATEEALRDSGIAFTALRNNWYSENYAGALAQAAASGTYADSTRGGLVASASRIDFADAAAAVLTTPGHENATYELAGDVAWDGAQLAAAMSEVLGAPVAYESLTPEAHVAALTAAGLDAETVGFLVALDQNIHDGLLAETTGDLSRLIGRPTTPLVEGLRATR
ncbi:MAG: SDR family oxidoreductase [Actinomycetota bacterium]